MKRVTVDVLQDVRTDASQELEDMLFVPPRVLQDACWYGAWPPPHSESQKMFTVTAPVICMLSKFQTLMA